MRAPGHPLGGPSEAESDGRQDAGEAFDIIMDFPEDNDDMGDPTAASSAMEAELIAAGTRKDAAQLFVNKIISNPGATTFMEMYGQGTIVSEDNRTRRSLNCKGGQGVLASYEQAWWLPLEFRQARGPQVGAPDDNR